MQGVLKTVVYVLAWEFMVVLGILIVNTTVFGYIIPQFDTIAASSSFVNYSEYAARTDPVKAAFNIALFILAVVPIVYLFIRLWLKREQTAPPALTDMPAWSYPCSSRIPGELPDNHGGAHVSI